jgi:hypothetical protein
MARSHEKIEYGINEVKNLFNASVMTGVIIEVNYDTDKADVEIDGLGRVNSVPIFYHCENETTTSQGSTAFEENDNVYILNEKGVVSPRISELKVIGFVGGLKTCGFYIDLKINGVVPKYWKTLKLIDAEGTIHEANSDRSDPEDPMYDKPWKIGPFHNVELPAQVFLGSEAQNPYDIGSIHLFNYFREGTGAPYPLQKTATAWTRPCYEYNELILYQLLTSLHTLPDPAMMEYIVPVIQVVYILHDDLLLSKPHVGTEVEFDFDVQMVGKLHTKFSNADFGTPGECAECSIKVEEKTFVANPEDVVFAPWVNCEQEEPCPIHCVFFINRPSCNATCRKAQSMEQYGYNKELSNYGHIVIYSDEDGRNPTFDEAEIVYRFFCSIGISQYEIDGSGCGELAYTVCSENVVDLEGGKWGYKMVPTWAERI